MDCPECHRLLDESERVQLVYTASVDRLFDRAESIDSAKYAALRARADEAQLELRLVRLELEQHRRVHSRADGPGVR